MDPIAGKRERIGWREWVGLPELGIDRIKAKIDTGARTSALHAFELTTSERDGRPWVEFGLHPRQRRSDIVMRCEAPVLDTRIVRDSGGHEEERLVIETAITLGLDRIRAEVTLTSRDNMVFRMLLGRTALRGRYLVDAGRSYIKGKSK